MPQKEKKHKLGGLVKYIIPIVISIGLCYLLFTGVDFKEMMSIIRHQCDFKWILLAMGICICSFVFRAFRWGIQLKALGVNPPKRALIYSIFGTYAVNLVFPRLGEVWRTGYMAQRQHAPFTTVFGSMVADRLADTVTVLLIAVVTFFLASDAIIEFLEENMSSYVAIGHLLTSPWLWGAGLVFILAFCILMKCKTEAAWILKMRQVVKELWLGFIGIVTMKGKGMWLLLTIGIWGCFTIQMYVCFLAFPFTRELVAENGWIVAQVAFVLGSISMGVPSNGGIGPWQWAVIFALGIYGLGRAEGAAFANLVLGTQTLMLILLGIFTFTAIAIDKRRRARLSGGETAVDGQEATGDEGGIF